jgi:hypothetical protein
VDGAPLLVNTLLHSACMRHVACASAPADPPATGSAPDERTRMVAWARQLEADPNPPGEAAESARMLVWLMNSPNVTVHVCPELTAPFVDEEVGFKPLSLFMFGAAAFVIEHPGPGVDSEPASLERADLPGQRV